MKLWMLADSNQTLFGHQDDLAYGVGWRGEPGRSDVLDTAGSYPAIYGWDVGGLELGADNLDGISLDAMRGYITEGYRRGGVITISWHMSNPVTGGGPWVTLEEIEDDVKEVSTILPGGANHAEYRRWLDEFAEFAKSLTVSGAPGNSEEHLVPVIFRPFHEHNGSVFWWGGRNTTEADYIALWHFTVQYLRDLRGVHNLLYAYSPDARWMSGRDSNHMFPDLDTFQSEYFYAYPGDDYVDVLGLDYYQNAYPIRRGVDDALYGLVRFQNSLDMLVETANEYDANHLKIPALTETGGVYWDEINANIWWTEFLYRGLIGTRSSGGQVAWALTWRNAAEDHYGAPYLGHLSVEDFVKFKNRPMIHFEDEIPFNLYVWP